MPCVVVLPISFYIFVRFTVMFLYVIHLLPFLLFCAYDHELVGRPLGLEQLSDPLLGELISCRNLVSCRFVFAFILLNFKYDSTNFIGLGSGYGRAKTARCFNHG